MTNTEKLLRELIALPSVNPAFLPEGHPRAGESRPAEYLGALAARAGLDVELKDVLPGRPNITAVLSPSGKTRQRVLLAPHLDTINGTDDQFIPVSRNGKIFGRGSCDTKGSVASMFSALVEIASRPTRPQETEIVFLGLIDEENAQAGSRYVASSHVPAALAIVGEPTRCRVVTAHKGSMWIEIVTRGRSAHGSQPEAGRNAVHLMSRIVDLIETTYATRLGERPHPVLGPATASVGVICGGTQPNVVPEQCSILIDRRTLPGETEPGVIRGLQALLREHKLKATVRSLKQAPCPPMETRADLPLVAGLLNAARQSQAVGARYFCDAAVLAGGGIPSVVFGPGDIAQAHTADEWVATSSIERATRTLVRFLGRLA